LRLLFSGLSSFASATDTQRAGNAHPSFAQIIKQLSPREAALLNIVLPALEPNGLPMIGARLIVDTIEPDEFVPLTRYMLNLIDDDGVPVVEPMLATWIDNWARLGLVVADYTSFRAADDAYAWAEQRPELMGLRSAYDTCASRVELEQGVLRPTDFGTCFRVAVTVPARASDP
jgi:hypothetical protein